MNREELITRYLRGELSDTERDEFEARLMSELSLQRDVVAQRAWMDSVPEWRQGNPRPAVAAWRPWGVPALAAAAGAALALGLSAFLAPSPDTANTLPQISFDPVTIQSTQRGGTDSRGAQITRPGSEFVSFALPMRACSKVSGVSVIDLEGTIQTQWRGQMQVRNIMTSIPVSDSPSQYRMVVDSECGRQVYELIVAAGGSQIDYRRVESKAAQRFSGVWQVVSEDGHPLLGDGALLDIDVVGTNVTFSLTNADKLQQLAWSVAEAALSEHGEGLIFGSIRAGDSNVKAFLLTPQPDGTIAVSLSDEKTDAKEEDDGVILIPPPVTPIEPSN